MIEMRRHNKMERLELLSHTALLKQGIDRTATNSYENNRCEKNESCISDDIKNPMSSRSQNYVSKESIKATTNTTAGTHRSTIEDSRNDLISSQTLLCHGATAMVGSNLPNPVSTDIEEEEDAEAVIATSSIAQSKIRHNPHDTKICMVESRNPVTTVEYAQYIAAAPSSPFPPSPRSYGYGFLTNHNNILHQNQSHDQQEYAPPQYNNCRGNIIRTLSEASFVSLYGSNLMPQNSQNPGVAASNRREMDAAFDPPQVESQPSHLKMQQRRSSPSREEMAQQMRELREQLSDKDMVVSSLQHRVNYLENQIHELRQLPTGKISHIPIDDMIRIMQEYGSEVSNQTLPQQRKQSIKKASIVRQFRRWNPNFFRFFLHHNGQWVPKLGKEGELRRRAEKRRLLLIARQNTNLKATVTK
mmetsp:Transcript_3297/g.8826  ORF Transcript_3297/g.8826 Transcript_3297/m.8826 type:complete len:416 (+) Transcript_3297:122-1369(+)|eukprot:CAMPEP_0197177082 /NCGR_PEP_ID=MMETSP1423-20130617/2811_1 /TAXON_ID=476441 /ORGANISM="Pseudo-nitzschia heimii, Strain UNC1101" /LENGTH=415 /DNA_ID=CAMNT_0042626573 /DNA_START=39 /DNA_END=1286 /DNA_ORIENTATION=+